MLPRPLEDALRARKPSRSDSTKSSARLATRLPGLAAQRIVRLLALQSLKQLVVLCMCANPKPVNVVIFQQTKNPVV